MQKDFVEYLFDKYVKKCDSELKPDSSEITKIAHTLKLANAEAFVQFARQFLKDNPPVAFDYTYEGNGVTLRNGDRSRFVSPVVDEPEFQMWEKEVPITKVNRSSRDMEPSFSVKV